MLDSLVNQSVVAGGLASPLLIFAIMAIAAFRWLSGTENVSYAGALLTAAGTAEPCGFVAPADAAGDALVALPGLMGAVGAGAIGLPFGGYGF